MRVNIYYGGRGLVDDPTIFVINKIQTVLNELNVQVERFNLYEMKNAITTLSQTITEADGVILATTVEWLGMGGFMQTLLDACWLYTDKVKAANVYMFPVVMSKTYGEREVGLTLMNSWEIIGGRNGSPLTAYVDDTTEFEFNSDNIAIIEKYAEDIYRTISKKMDRLPSSSQSIKKSIMKETLRLTPQESEQLSKYASDDVFVKTQKEDIESLSSMYKELMTDQENGGDDYYLDVFKDSFDSSNSNKCTYMLVISDKDKNICIDVDKHNCKVEFGQNPAADVVGKLDKSTFDSIVNAKNSFHRAFMTGEMTARGNLKTLRMLDEIFKF